MQSSNKMYYQSLDHVRAVAAFTVFAWHFNHFNSGQHQPPLVFPLSFLTEGHTGVAIFMTLSGYLFAKITENKQIIYGGFVWNRFIRLVPLLAFAILLDCLQRYYYNTLDIDYLLKIVEGALYPSLPVNGWSITVEFHFYLILPILLFFAARSIYLLLIVLLAAVSLRLVLYHFIGEIQSLAYSTIIGRIDQFIFGIVMYKLRYLLEGRRTVVVFAGVSFLIFWYFFDLMGGFYKSPSYPSPSPLWLIIPTIEGVCYAIIIAGYDVNFRYSSNPLSRFVALIGVWSYSLYLMHIFLVFRIPRFIDQHLLCLSNPYLVLVLIVPSFLAVLPVAFLTHRYVERPFLALRTVYLRDIG